MSRSVLVGVDGSEQSTGALEYALTEFPDARILALHVIDPVETFGNEEYDSVAMSEVRREVGEEICETAAETAATEYGREIDTRIRMGRPSRIIVSVVEAEDIDHVVVGSHGRTGLARVLLGSVAESVVRRSPVPVTVVR
ncbi:universal stress protein [Natronomonas marina]|jgi:nucleotide-binding universal stress UspA family protein|uniref:universal stress protein n=1 Tax=Natronomonas marina TaxID=2961939 RepID=UPI0020CA1BDC|nr:universal stress protein [Natronomonas marina]